MDRVRFGRALGYGARHAAKSLQKAAQAASAPGPAQPTRPPSRPAATQPEVLRGAARSATQTQSAGQTQRATQPQAQRASQTQYGKTQRRAAAKSTTRRLGRSVWGPLAKFSSVVWLQVTGTFFTLLALFLSEGLWKQRGAMRLPVSSHVAEKFYLQLGAFVLFTYFAISNFVRAQLRDKR